MSPVNKLIDAGTLTFDDWLMFLVEHPYGVTFETGAALMERLRHMFASPHLLDFYSPAQINKMFWVLLGESGLLHPLFEETIALESRLAVIQAMLYVFTDLFAKQCDRGLSHLEKEYGRMNPLNSACYMWWDLFPSWGSPEPRLRKVDEAILALQAETLDIPHIAVQESALHGLGHWHLRYPAETEEVVDSFLRSKPDVPPQLIAYARAARCGCVN